MNTILEKLVAKEREISEEKGAFCLFALFLREDAPNRWDLVVSAPWITRDKVASLEYLASKTQEALDADELLLLSRIVVLNEDNPGLDALQRTVSIEHGTTEIEDSSFFGLEIKRAYLITSKRRHDSSPDPSRAAAQ